MPMDHEANLKFTALSIAYLNANFMAKGLLNQAIKMKWHIQHRGLS